MSSPLDPASRFESQIIRDGCIFVIFKQGYIDVSTHVCIAAREENGRLGNFLIRPRVRQIIFGLIHWTRRRHRDAGSLRFDNLLV